MSLRPLNIGELSITSAYVFATPFNSEINVTLESQDGSTSSCFVKINGSPGRSRWNVYTKDYSKLTALEGEIKKLKGESKANNISFGKKMWISFKLYWKELQHDITSAKHQTTATTKQLSKWLDFRVEVGKNQQEFLNFCKSFRSKNRSAHE